MKNIILIFMAILLLEACTKQDTSTAQTEVANLKKQIESLKPGLGEIMGVIQQHHAKLYYSGMNENWDLAAYQIDEIKEGLDQATELHEHFKDIKGSLKDLRHVTDQGVAETEAAIQKKSKILFLGAYKNLTHSCNQCHQAADHGFIVIQSPVTGMFSNQKFAKGIK